MNPAALRVCLVLATLAALGCHPHRATVNPYLHGRPPEYRIPEQVASKESLGDFVTRVRQAQAESLKTRTRAVVPTVETTDAALRAALNRLRAAPSAEAHRRVAGEYLRLSVRDTAMDHYSAALALDPRDGLSYEMRARIWRDWGFPGNGLGDAYRALHYSPRSPAAYNTLGTLLQRLGRRADARVAYRRALELDPGAAYALNNLCALALDEGQPDAAMPSCRQALDLDPRLGAAQRNLQLASALLNDRPAEAANARH